MSEEMFERLITVERENVALRAELSDWRQKEMSRHDLLAELVNVKAELEALKVKWNHEGYLADKRAVERDRAETEREALRAELSMKRDALNSYAEFYDKISRALGYGDVLPGSATDDAIIMRLCRGRELVIDNTQLREAIGWALASGVTSDNVREKLRAALGVKS